MSEGGTSQGHDSLVGAGCGTLGVMSAQPMSRDDLMDGCSRCGAVHDPARCDAHSRSGSQCGNPRGKDTVHVGYGHCGFHGGASENGWKHAEAERRRALMALVIDAPAAVAKLREMANRDDLPPHVQLAAIRDWLDRAEVGRGSGVSVDLTVSPVDRQAELLERIRALRDGTVIETTISGGA